MFRPWNESAISNIAHDSLFIFFLKKERKGLKAAEEREICKHCRSPEICPQINDLPGAQSDQHAHRSQSKPFNALVRTLIGVSQFLLPTSHIVHLSNDLTYQRLNPTKVSLNGLKFLLRLDSRPITGVGPNINIELHVTGRVADV